MTRETALVVQILNESEQCCHYLTVTDLYDVLIPGTSFKTKKLILDLHDDDGNQIEVDVTPDELIDAGMALLNAGIKKKREEG